MFLFILLSLLFRTTASDTSQQCSHIDGKTIVNTTSGECLCGTNATCTNHHYCVVLPSGAGSCNKFPGHYGYRKRVKGKCDDLSHSALIRDVRECEIGAAAVGLGNNVTATYLDTWSAAHHSAPLGCHVPDLNQPTNMLVKSASLYDQKISHDPRVFVRTKCTNNKPCLCFEASDCPHTNGLIENPFPCLCRSMGWSDGAAVFDGTINNNTYYQPSLGCSPSKGGYCNGPQQRCSHFPIPTLDERMPLSRSFYVFNTVVLSCLLLFASYYLIDLSRAALQR